MKKLTIHAFHGADAHDIFCFGGGKALQSFVSVLQRKHLLKDVLAVIDNNPTKWGTSIEAKGQKLPVISPMELCQRIGETKNAKVVITCLAKDAIRSQLAGYLELAETPVGYYQDLVNDWWMEAAEQMTFPNGLGSTKEPLIPKVIHYCWFGGKPIPSEFQHYIDSWQRMCPDYEIRRWDESNYDVTKNAYMKAAYEAKKWGFVPDYARLDIVYEHGGIYLDTDVELVKNLDELRYNHAFMGMDMSTQVSLGLGFGAAPHHPMLKTLRDAYLGYAFQDFKTQADFSAAGVAVGPAFIMAP